MSFKPLGTIVEKIVSDCALRMKMRERGLTDADIERVMARVSPVPPTNRRADPKVALTGGQAA